jgi:hypothetical protein
VCLHGSQHLPHLHIASHKCCRPLTETAVEITAGLEVARPHIAPHVVTPAAADPPPDQRLRPLIYVYDLPAEFNTRMLQVQAVEGAVRQCCWCNNSSGTLWCCMVCVSTCKLAQVRQAHPKPI